MMRGEWGLRHMWNILEKKRERHAERLSLDLSGKQRLTLETPGNSSRETTTERRGLPPLEGKANPEALGAKADRVSR